MDEFIGVIKLFAGNFAPNGWMFCQGQTLPISQNTALFSLLGTQYGGNGQTTFMLPDLRGRVPVGFGQGPGLTPIEQGAVGGVESVTILPSQMPSHSHNVNIPTSDVIGSSENPSGHILTARGAADFALPSDVSGNYGGVTISATGGNQPLPIMQPYLGLNYIICLQGVFPSRS